MAVRIGIWSLRLMAYDRESHETDFQFDARNIEAFDRLSECLSDLENLANNNLDEGFYVKIEQ